jgi:hypothetical protein
LKHHIIPAVLLLFCLPTLAAPPLRVSQNKRFLVRSDGTPFFYLGDTAWELFHRLTREDAERYLTIRAKQRFTVIQAVVLAEFDGLVEPNAYGHLPIKDKDPRQPVDGYFQHIDWIVDKAAEHGLIIGMLPSWGSWVNENNIFTPATARVWGEYLGRRYKDKQVIWILGGDRNPLKASQTAIWRAMAEGIVAASSDAVITFHPSPGDLGSSSQFFHHDPWLTFNMHQNGHCAEKPVWETIEKDYELRPIKPVMDGEPIYEDHPICFDSRNRGYSTASDARRFLYWELFAGAFGHTYGNHAVWQMWSPERKPINGPLFYWTDAVNRPGAQQMQHARALLESRPFLTRIPDQSIVVPATVPGSVPGAGLKRIEATRASDGAYAMVYIPASRAFTVRLDLLSGSEVKAWWFDPRTGTAAPVGTFPKTATREFTPPGLGEQQDWILVLDDAARNFPPPGASPWTSNN